ncbi:receptor-like protein kinase FERONIA [Corylus avellana]|uniref:receptor-like protein kinase FERONIA n=1 Tax=Corylus avellana TaxID=13451 RepID=UPI00286A154B|nr:receptor-like protein kinase FERONIA [Corylus avellana]
MQSSCKSYVYFFSVFVFLNCLTSVTGKAKPSSPHSCIDNVVLSCGSSAISTDPDGKEWTGDIGSKFVSSQPNYETSAVSNSTSQSKSVNRVPYTTARIFLSQFTYSFRVSPGRKFIRFFFNPAKYQGFDRFKAYFTVTAGPFTLLSNFNASLSAHSVEAEVFVQNFCVNVEEGQRVMNITFIPSTNASVNGAYAFINGIEIVSMPTSLDYSCIGNKGVPLSGRKSRFLIENSSTAPSQSDPKHDKHSKHTKLLPFLVIFGASLCVVIVFFLLGITIFWQRKRAESQKNQTSVADLEGLCRRFSLEEIFTATNNLDRKLVVGRGGCGFVFKGYIGGKPTPVAIKLFDPTSRQGFHEFRTEIELLSKLRHRHLVPLIGYCNDDRHMIIVYDFMAHGTLRDHLYNTDNPPLSWKQRLEICIGAARGLLYLHEGAEHPIIHRDVNTSNILLDEDWVAKVSDFGLSKLGPKSLSKSHVTTDVKGTFGYLDPQYFWTSKLTVKSDVFGFGVVLFEVLCARPAVDMGLDDEKQSLTLWAQQCFRDRTLDQIIDSRVIGLIAPACLKVYAKIAYKCLYEERDRRPKMAEVLKALEFAMKLQEIADAGAHTVVIDEEVPLCGEGNLVVSCPADNGDLVHSCPTFWKRSLSRKELLRHFSEKAVKWVKSPKPSCLKAYCCGAAEYNGAPRVQVQMPDLSCCGPYTTPEKILIEITNIEGQ